MATNGKPGQTVTQALVQVRNAGTSQSISNFVHSNPELAAQVTKLLQPKTPKTFDGKGRQEVTAPRVDSVLQISQRISQKSTDAKAVMQLFPDVRLAAEILALSDDALAEKLEAERVSMAQQIAAKEEKLQNELNEL